MAQHSAAHPAPCFCLCYNLSCSSGIPPSFFLPLPPVFRRYITLAAKGYSFSSLFHFYERSLLYPQPGSLSGKPIYDFMISFLRPPFPRKGSLPSLLFALPPPLSLSLQKFRSRLTLLDSFPLRRHCVTSPSMFLVVRCGWSCSHSVR